MQKPILDRYYSCWWITSAWRIWRKRSHIRRTSYKNNVLQW